MRSRSLSFAFLAALAAAQTRGQSVIQKPPAERLPNVIDTCWEQKPGADGTVCSIWLREGVQYRELSTDTSIITVERFDAGSVKFLRKKSGLALTYSGKITGNHIQGTLSYSLDPVPTAKPTIFKWSASFFYPASGDAATGRHVYVACDRQVSIINTADHSVKNVKLEDLSKSDPPKNVAAIAVSPDSSKAYVSNEGGSYKWHPATLFVIDGTTGTITQRFGMKDTPTPSGVASLAVSGDGSTLYGIGWDRQHLGTAAVALDAASGATKATVQLATYGQTSLVVAGSKLVLEDGKILNIDLPRGAPLVFSSNGAGTAAFPDGTRICSKGQVLAVGTGASLRKQGCSAISPDGTKTYLGGMLLRSENGTQATNPNFGAIVGQLGPAVGITSDGKTLDTIGASSMVYTIDAVTNLTTDAIKVCEQPRLLGMEPLATPVKPAVLETTATPNPNRVVAMVDGKPITAQQATNMLKGVAPPVRRQYETRLEDLVQRLYMQHQVVQEALNLHLDRQSPWKEKLASAHHQIFPLEIGPGQFPPPNLEAMWQNARERILWDAYFSQASTAEERKTFHEQKREQYKIQVQDPDFFKSPH